MSQNCFSTKQKKWPRDICIICSFVRKRPVFFSRKTFRRRKYHYTRRRELLVSRELRRRVPPLSGSWRNFDARAGCRSFVTEITYRMKFLRERRRATRTLDNAKNKPKRVTFTGRETERYARTTAESEICSLGRKYVSQINTLYVYTLCLWCSTFLNSIKPSWVDKSKQSQNREIKSQIERCLVAIGNLVVSEEKICLSNKYCVCDVQHFSTI